MIIYKLTQLRGITSPARTRTVSLCSDPRTAISFVIVDHFYPHYDILAASTHAKQWSNLWSHSSSTGWRKAVSMVISYPETVLDLRWSIFPGTYIYIIILYSLWEFFLLSFPSSFILSGPSYSFRLASRCQQQRECPHWDTVSDTSHNSDNRPQNRPSTVRTPADVTGKWWFLGIPLWPKLIQNDSSENQPLKG